MFRKQARGEVRAVLPEKFLMRGEDGVKGGVGARLIENVAQIRPYLFRLACSNGSLYSLGFASSDINVLSPNFERELREAVTACLDPDLHEDLAGQMDAAHEYELDITTTAMTLASHISRLPAHMSGTMALVIEKLLAQRQRNLFALIQSVTAVARDSDEDFDRWELESLGGLLVHEGKNAIITPEVPELARRGEVSSILGV